MKNCLLLAAIALTTFSCSPKTENATATADAHVFGVNYDSTAHMDAIKATLDDIEKSDTVSYLKKYADTAVFNDNGKKMTLAENVAVQRNFISSGIKVKVNRDYAMWSSHFNFKDSTQADFVYTYVTVNFSKGDKNVDVVFFQADKFNKDGKITEEYIVYDQSGLATLMK
jgi:hypothetical protein